MGQIGIWKGLLYISLCTSIVGCASQRLPVNGAESPLLFDPAEVENSDAIAVFIPGALAPIDIFSPAKAWRVSGYALVYYRFPGLDGLPLDHELSIDGAAEEIAQFANRYPQKPIRLLGYSTGGPIAILASQRISGDDVKVAALSPAPPKAGGFWTAWRSSYDVIAASIRAGSTRREKVWREYYRTLLFGRAGLKNPGLADRIDQLAEQQREKIVIPERDMNRAHTRDIRRWTVPGDLYIDREKVTFYIGAEDPVFSVKQIWEFAESIGVTRVIEYPKGGHLLFITHPEVFNDVLSFFGESKQQQL